MFCSHCGIQIPDGAKFCFNCGANLSQNISENSMSIANNLGNNEPKIIFSIQDTELSFDSRHKEYAARRKEFLKQVQPFIEEEGERIQEKVDDIIAHAEKNQSSRIELDKSFLEYYDYGTKAVDLFVKTIHDYLIKEKVYAYSLDMIKVASEDAIGNFTHTLADFSVKLSELMSATDSLEQARTMQRGSRSYWQGGGFGMVNSIKGSITAGLMNIATNSVRGIGDFIVDVGDDRRIFQSKYELLKSKPWIKLLREALIKDSYNIFHLYATFLEAENGLQLPPIDEKTSGVLFDNSKYINSPSEKTKVLIQSILNNPYNPDPYGSLLAEYNLSSDVIKLVDYFLDFYGIKWLSVTFSETIIERLTWNNDSEDIFTVIKRMHQTIKDTISLVEAGKSSSEFYNFYDLYCMDTLRKGLSMIKEARKTSSDGIVHNTIEERDLYEKEYQQYKQCEVDDPSSISIEEERQLIEKAKSFDFNSKILLQKIQDRESGLTIRIKAQEALDTFEGRFAYTWPDKQTDAYSKMPKRAQDAFSLLKYGQKATVLACYKIGIDGTFFDEASQSLVKRKYPLYLVVSDYYIVLWRENFTFLPYAIRTKDIRTLTTSPFKLSSEGSILFDEIWIHKYYSEEPDRRMENLYSEKDRVALSDFTNKVNQTITAVRSNISFSPEATNINQHLNEMNDLSYEFVKETFQQMCWIPDDSWKQKGKKYVDTVVNSACKGMVSPDDIIYFEDTSLFNNGKVGFAITYSSLISKDMTSPDSEFKVDYKRICDVTISHKERSNKLDGILISLDNGNKCHCWSCSDFLTETGCEQMVRFLGYIRFLLN